MARRDLTGPEFIDQFIFGASGFIPRDVQRAINQAAQGDHAPNFPIALALLCYTEVLGRYEPTAGKGSRQRFEQFIRRMGTLYGAQLDAGHNLYRDFRCGMAHNYMIAGSSEISIRVNDEGEPVCGLGTHPSGWRFMNIERYFIDFMKAAHALRIELTGSRHAMAHMWNV